MAQDSIAESLLSEYKSGGFKLDVRDEYAAAETVMGEVKGGGLLLLLLLSRYSPSSHRSVVLSI